MTTAILGVFALTTLTLLLGWGYFRRCRLHRPPIGVMTLGDVLVLLAGTVLLPLLYLMLPAWLVAATLALGTLGILQLVVEPVLPTPGLSWVVAGGLVGADILLAARGGSTSLAYLAVNDLVLVLVVVGVTNLWAQSGLRARDLALLAAALTAYDVIATALLPLTIDLIARLATLPFTPLLGWSTGDGGWLGLGLGDLLLATLGPLVLRKAFSKTAGLVALFIALATIGVVLTLPLLGLRGAFPVMVVLGPLLVGQWAFWRRHEGPERTTATYLAAEPNSAPCTTAAQTSPCGTPSAAGLGTNLLQLVRRS